MTILESALFAGIASCGFAVLFNMPRGLLGLCVLAAVAGHATRGAAMSLGVGLEIGTLLGALVIGMLADLLSRRVHAPAMVFAVPAAIPFVPGAFAFKAMMGFATIASTGGQLEPSVVSEALANALRAVLILGAIATGISLPVLLLARRSSY